MARSNRTYYREITQEELDDLEIILQSCCDLIDNDGTSGLFANRLSRSMSTRRIRSLLRKLKGETYTKKAG